MKIKQEVTTMLSKRMDRQDFLKHIAIGVVALTGAGAALRLLSAETKHAPSVAQGYGGSAYGGEEEGKS